MSRGLRQALDHDRAPRLVHLRTLTADAMSLIALNTCNRTARPSESVACNTTECPTLISDIDRSAMCYLLHTYHWHKTPVQVHVIGRIPEGENEECIRRLCSDGETHDIWYSGMYSTQTRETCASPRPCKGQRMPSMPGVSWSIYLITHTSSSVTVLGL